MQLISLMATLQYFLFQFQWRACVIMYLDLKFITKFLLWDMLQLNHAAPTRTDSPLQHPPSLGLIPFKKLLPLGMNNTIINWVLGHTPQMKRRAIYHADRVERPLAFTLFRLSPLEDTVVLVFD